MTDQAREIAGERAILNAATALYHQGSLPYVTYSPFYDAQVIRIAALEAIEARALSDREG